MPYNTYPTMFNSAEFIANPYPTYSDLRLRGPIHRVNSTRGVWLLPRYGDVVSALNDPRLSARRSQIIIDRLPASSRSDFAEFRRIIAMWLGYLDPAQHNRIRKTLTKGFAPHVLQAMRPRIQKIADSLLDRVQNVGQMEFMREFACPFPVLVIAEMLGVDPARQADFTAWTDDFVAFFAQPKPTPELARQAQNGLIAITEYFRAILPERRKHVGDDLISLLVQIEGPGNLLTTEQLLAQCSMLLISGNATMRNFLGNGLLALLQNPDQLEKLRNDPALMPHALPELLRYDGPEKFLARRAIKEFTLHGQQIKQGQFVYGLIGSANRDPAKFTAPDVLDITRKEGPHLTFGSGSHSCLGAPLAYLEAEIVFSTLFERMPNLRLVDESPDWSQNYSIRALNTLRLTF